MVKPFSEAADVRRRLSAPGRRLPIGETARHFLSGDGALTDAGEDGQRGLSRAPRERSRHTLHDLREDAT